MEMCDLLKQLCLSSFVKTLTLEFVSRHPDLYNGEYVQEVA